MSFDIYGNRLARGHCEVHPHVHQEYPCDLCLSQRSPKQRAPAGPMCGICGGHEACADSCGVAVCSEACDHEARRRHNESETLRARIAELEVQVAAQHDAMRTEWKDLLARAERAEAALRQLGKHPESCGDDCVSELARLDLLAERDALRADVERYRWLRSHSDGFWSCHEKDGYGGDVLKYGEDLDAAVDAARGVKE